VAADIKAPAGLASYFLYHPSRRQPPHWLLSSQRYKVMLKDGNYPLPTATSAAAGDAAYCLNSVVSSPMPSIATVTVSTGSFMTPTDVPQAIGEHPARRS
jgi:hypothetical protein